MVNTDQGLLPPATQDFNALKLMQAAIYRYLQLLLRSLAHVGWKLLFTGLDHGNPALQIAFIDRPGICPLVPEQKSGVSAS
jgi:hypothetical protein